MNEPRASGFRVVSGRAIPRLAPRHLRALRATAECESGKAAAAMLGTSLQTHKGNLTDAYAVLGVSGAISAFRKLGWLHPFGHERSFSAASGLVEVTWR